MVLTLRYLGDQVVLRMGTPGRMGYIYIRVGAFVCLESIVLLVRPSGLGQG